MIVAGLRGVSTRLASRAAWSSFRCLSVACCNAQTTAAPLSVPIGMPMGMPMGIADGVSMHRGLLLQDSSVTSIGDLIRQQEEYRMDSVMRKRRTKMKKHKLRKRRKRQKAEKRKQSQG